MLTAALVKIMAEAIGYLDSILPTVTWPDWMSVPSDWLDAHMLNGSFNVNGISAWIHPITLDLTIAMVGIRRLMRSALSLREKVSVALGSSAQVLPVR